MSRDTCAAYLTYSDWNRSSSRFLMFGILLEFWLPKTRIGVVVGILALFGLVIMIVTLAYVLTSRSAVRAALAKEFGLPPKPLLGAMRRGPKAVAAQVDRR